jgi:hypothetical protein
VNPFLIAYIDPGAGGVLMQLLFGGTAGIAIVLKLFWDRLRGRRARQEPNTSESVHGDDTGRI